MEEKEEINDFGKGECISNNDADFCSFYYRAVKRLLDIDNKTNVSYLYRYAEIFNKYYDFFSQEKFEPKDENDSLIKLLGDSLYFRLIYVYKNAALLSSAVAFYFRNICKQHPDIIQRLIKKKQVKICSIGGRSTSDIVAVITVQKSIALKNDIDLDFRVTVIGLSANWKITCMTVLSCLEEFHKATWKINFIQCNLSNTNAWTPETLKAIQEADVVTMVKYAPKFNNKWNIVKMICDKLETQAIFFILDHPETRLIELYLRIMDDFHLIHVELCDYHTLDIQAVKYLWTLYKKHFGGEKQLISNISCDVFVSVWIKASSEKDTRHKKNLECFFQAHEEKYNPKQSFLSNKALGRWERLFTINKYSAGWNAKSIKKYVEEEKEKRNKMIGKLIHQKKEMESLQNDLRTQVQSLENDGKVFSGINEESFDDYLIQKRQYALTKRSSYFASLSANNLCSTFE